jgi:tetratricopeptide (TPR) repeat protein
LTKFVAGFVIAGTLSALVWAQAAPQWKDQGESDIGLAASNEKDPAKQLDLLKKWEQQYPESALKSQRTLMTAQALLGVLGVAYGKTDPAVLSAGQKAGQELESHFNQYFDDSVKPGPATAEQWATARKTSEMQVHMVLAYIAQAQKNDEAAEAELKKTLAVDPNQATASYQLGSTIIHEMAVSKDLSRYSEALYDLARATAVTGPTALTGPTKTSADSALKKNYGNYHGSAEGMDDLVKQASASALPPAGFHIPSIVDIEQAKEKDHAAWAAQHPDLDFWENIKTALTTQGDSYFANLKDVGFPPPPSDSYKGPAMFRAKVVSVPNPKQILVSVDNVPTGDAILKFDDNIKGDIPAGTDIQFKGVVDSYTKDPGYILTLNIQEPKTDIVGLPDDVKFVPDAAAKPKPGTKGTKTAPKAAKKTTSQ